MSKRHGDHLLSQHRRRAFVLIGVVALIALAAATEPVQEVLLAGIESAGNVIQRHSVLGAVVFVLLSAASAMVVFFSTAIVTPIAVEAFGTIPTLLLLWTGWVLGGMTAWAIGRYFGARVVSWFVDSARLRAYEERASRLVDFRHVLLFQLAVPSEIPGYVLGLAGCRFRTFVLGMAIAELPFAVGAVYLGESFLHGRYLAILALGIAGVAITWLAFHRVSSASAAETAPQDEISPRVTEGAGGG